jgi:histidinol-phosphate aminotransferase
MKDHLQQPFVPDNIKNLSPYVAGKTIREVREAYHPDQISKLASNENRLGCSPLVPPALAKAVEEIQDYPDPAARKLKAALAQKNSVSDENIILAAGSESLIAILLRTFFQNNEEAITADATFVGFFVQANIRGITLTKIPVTSGFRFDVDAIAEAVTNRTKMIYIANPNNPTGTFITRKEFEKLMEAVPDDVLMIMDEAYFEYAQEIEDYPRAADYDYDNVLSLHTFSKAYGLAGLRIGYAIGPKELIQTMSKTKLTFEPSALGQAAALAALEDEEFLAKSKQIVEKGKTRLYRFFDERQIPYVRSSANSVLMICERREIAEKFTQKMLEQGVILRQTNAFGLPHCIRITIGTEENMQHFERSFEELSHILRE